MQEKMEQIVGDLKSMEFETKLNAVRTIKNSIIGNKTKKSIYLQLQAIPHLVNILKNDTETPLIIQTAATLGSFSCGCLQGATELVKEGAIESLLFHMNSQDLKVVETVTRSLKILYEYDFVPRDILFKENIIQIFINLLSSENGVICEVTASLIAKSCQKADHQRIISPAIDVLTKLLFCQFPKAQESALDALSSISYQNTEISIKITQNIEVVERMMSLLKAKRPQMRLTAVRCISTIYRSVHSKNVFKNNEMIVIVLPTIIKLLSDEGKIKEEIPLILANLIMESEDLQKAACEAGAVTKLIGFLRESTSSERMKENVLYGLSALCSLNEDGRKHIMDSKILRLLLTDLEHPNKRIQQASCKCLIGLSRSTRQIRNSMIEAGIVTPILKLFSQRSTKLQGLAVAVICNMVLDFENVKKFVVEKGAVDSLVEFTESMDHTLRLNSIWTLKNLVCRADFAVKQKVIKQLTFDNVFKLLNDSDTDIQEQTMNLVRNLVHGELKDIEYIVNLAGSQILMAEISKKLDSCHTGILEQALYILCNMAAATEDVKKLVMKKEIIYKVLGHMSHENSSVRGAAVFVIINLTFRDDSNADFRVNFLKEMGCREQLKSLLDDTELGVRDRAKQALDSFCSPSTSNSE